MSDRPPWASAYYARRTVQALCLFAEGPRSALELAEHLQVAGSAARRLIGRLADDGLVEEHPDSHRQHRRYRMAAGGYDFGLLLVASGLRELERREREHDALTVGQTLARYRRARGLSQGDFAALLDVSRPVLEKIELGRREVDGHELAAFASRLGVDLLDLLTLRRGGTATD